MQSSQSPLGTKPGAGAERRMEPRTPAQLVVHFRCGDGEAEESRSANLSYNGLFVVTEQTPEVGSDVAFELHADDGAPPLMGQAAVRWLRPREGGEPAGIGLEFLALGAAERERVQVLVHRYLAAKTARQEAPEPAPPAPWVRPWLLVALGIVVAFALGVAWLGRGALAPP